MLLIFVLALCIVGNRMPNNGFVNLSGPVARSLAVPDESTEGHVSGENDGFAGSGAGPKGPEAAQ